MAACPQFADSSVCTAFSTCCSPLSCGWSASWSLHIICIVFFSIIKFSDRSLFLQLTGESVWDMWKAEVLKYTFSTSLIDVAGVAMIRFLLLVFAYGAIQMNHWTIVAVSYSHNRILNNRFVLNLYYFSVDDRWNLHVSNNESIFVRCEYFFDWFFDLLVWNWFFCLLSVDGDSSASVPGVPGAHFVFIVLERSLVFGLQSYAVRASSQRNHGVSRYVNRDIDLTIYK